MFGLVTVTSQQGRHETELSVLSHTKKGDPVGYTVSQNTKG